MSRALIYLAVQINYKL
jgi:Ca2+-binding EF-hand superfamily protein